jgi:hypothetical protein
MAQLLVSSVSACNTLPPMSDTPPEACSPRVLANSWGHLDVEGLGELTDAKLWPGGGRAWDWTETGTHHHPGIQPADVTELLDHDPEVIVLSRGRELRLETMATTLDQLAQRGIRVVWDETGDAIDMYNELAAEGARVAALLHSTC